jgi:hypothetical protein
MMTPQNGPAASRHTYLPAGQTLNVFALPPAGLAPPRPTTARQGRPDWPELNLVPGPFAMLPRVGWRDFEPARPAGPIQPRLRTEQRVNHALLDTVEPMCADPLTVEDAGRL